MTEEPDQISIASPLWEEGEAEFETHIVNIIKSARSDLGLEPVKSTFSIILADDQMLTQLNRDFRGKDKPTNVLSFPSGFQAVPGDEPSLGEIFISYETLVQEAESQHKSFIHHLQHMVLHGFLHLLGYDHEEDRDAEAMEAIETRILAQLNIPNPYEEAYPAHA